MIINDESAIFEILETYELNSDEPQLKENILSLVRPTGNESYFKIKPFFNNWSCILQCISYCIYQLSIFSYS